MFVNIVVLTLSSRYFNSIKNISFFKSSFNRNNEIFFRRNVWLEQETENESISADKIMFKMLPQKVVESLKDGDSVTEEHNNGKLIKFYNF